MRHEEISNLVVRAATATGEELLELLGDARLDVLLAILDNPRLDETHLGRLIARKDLPGEVLEELGRRKPLLKSYRVRKALVFHPRAPRLAALRLLRELYLMDLIDLTMIPGVAAELKRNAAEQVVARLPQLPLGQKITLARRGPARVVGALLAEGHQQTTSIVLDNANLTEGQILKVLAREKLVPQVVLAIIRHQKWSHIYSIRLALVRNAASPLAAVLTYLPELTVGDLRELAAPGIVAENLRNYLEAEIQRRLRSGVRPPAEGKGSGT